MVVLFVPRDASHSLTGNAVFVGLRLDDSHSVLLARCVAICNSLYAVQTCCMKPLCPLVPYST